MAKLTFKVNIRGEIKGLLHVRMLVDSQEFKLLTSSPRKEFEDQLLG